MQFDINKLFENPTFMAGMSLLGNHNEGGIGQAMQMIQQAKQLKAQQEMQQRKLSLEQQEHESVKGYRAEQTNFMRAQATAKEREIKLAQAKHDANLRFLQQMGLGGDGTSPQPAMPGSSMPGAAVPSPPASQMQTIPQLSKGPTNASEAAMKAQAAGPMGADPKALDREIATVTADLARVTDQSSKDQLNAWLLDLKQWKSALGAPKVLGGSNEQQAKGHVDFQALAAQAAKARKIQQLAGASRIMQDDPAGYGMVIESMKPDFETPKLQLQQDKFTYEQNKDLVEQGFKERQVGAAETQAQAAQARAAADQDREARQQVAATRERSAKIAEDRKSFGALHINTDLLNSKADTLAAHPGLERIFGIQGALPDYPGSDAANARQLQKSTIAQMAKETLAAIRDASKTGGALGNVSDKDIALLETAIASLDKAQSPAAAKKALAAVKEHSNRLRNLSAAAYEDVYGESPFDKDLPKGSRPTGQKSKRGLPLFKAPNGKIYEVDE